MKVPIESIKYRLYGVDHGGRYPHSSCAPHRTESFSHYDPFPSQQRTIERRCPCTSMAWTIGAWPRLPRWAAKPIFVARPVLAVAPFNPKAEAQQKVASKTRVLETFMMM